MPINYDYVRKLTELILQRNRNSESNSETRPRGETDGTTPPPALFSSGETLLNYLKEKKINTSLFSRPTEEIAKLDLSGDTIERTTNQEESVPKENQEFYKTLQELYKDPLIADLIDKDDDNKISNEEAQAFLESIKGKDGDDNNISIDDITKFLDEVNAEVKAQGGEAQTPTPESTAEQATTEPNAQTQPAAAPAAQPTQAYGNGLGDYPAISNGAGRITPGQGPLIPSTTPENRKTQLEEQINLYKRELSEIGSGTQNQVKAALDARNTAKENMEAKVQADSNIEAGLRANHASVTNQILQKDNALAKCNAEIAQTEASIRQGESNLTSLKNALSSLPQQPDEKVAAQINARKQELQRQITQQEQELKTLRDKLDGENGLKKEKTKLEGEKAQLNNTLQAIEADINKSASPETKQAISAYHAAEQNVDNVRATETSRVQRLLGTAEAELTKVNNEIQTNANNKATSQWDFNFSENLTAEQRRDLARFKSHYEQNKSRYEAVARQLGIPAELIASIHWRESEGNFNTYLHNGDPLGRPTTSVPRNILCHTWEQSAVHAINSKLRQGERINNGDTTACLAFAERYNGMGYRRRGVSSPYVWAGTNNYSSGKFVADGRYNAFCRDRQLGVAVMMKAICA